MSLVAYELRQAALLLWYVVTPFGGGIILAEKEKEKDTHAFFAEHFFRATNQNDASVCKVCIHRDAVARCGKHLSEDWLAECGEHLPLHCLFRFVVVAAIEKPIKEILMNVVELRDLRSIFRFLSALWLF